MSIPQIQFAINQFSTNIQALRITKTIDDDFISQEVVETIDFFGTIQPMKPETIMLKNPEKRSFKWCQIHIQNPTFELLIDDVIIYNNIRYIITDKFDYQIYNYYEYHAVQQLN